MKFEPGDLVMIRPNTTIYHSLEAASNVGIVITSAVLMYAHSPPSGEKLNFYAYDVIFDGQTYRNIPEEVLRGLENNDETNFK